MAVVVKSLLIFGIFINFDYIHSNHLIKKRFTLFQNNSVLQFSSGLSVPLILPRRTINLSLVGQVNYDLPSRIQHLRPSIFQAKTNDNFDINRTVFYNYIIEFLDSMGLEGEQCLLRIVCEISEYPVHLDHKENLLEEIVHFIFTPSLDVIADNTTDEISFNNRLIQAEQFGRSSGRCNRHFSACSIPLVDIFTAKYLI